MRCETERVHTKPETLSEAPFGVLLAARYMVAISVTCGFAVSSCPCYCVYSNRKNKAELKNFGAT